MFITEFMVTERCNLNCSYCYIKQKSVDMNTDIVDNFIKYRKILMNFYKTNTFFISYFGGEPLLNFDIIKYSENKFRTLSDFRGSNIISNGLLIDESIVSWIKDNKVGFSLSFDGLWNNENRPLHNGIASFQEYLNKKDIIKEVAPGSCKVMISRINISSMTENFVWFVEEWGYNNPDFSLIRDDIWQDTDIENFRIEMKRLTQKSIEYCNKGIQAVPGLITLWIADTYQGLKYGKRPFGCFAGNRGCGYSPGGIFYPCARFASNKEYPLINTTIDLIHWDNIKSLYSPVVYDPRSFQKCNDCSLYNICNAGCTYSQLKYNQNKTEDTIIKSLPITNVCKLYNIIFENVNYFTKSVNHKIIQNILKGVFKNG